MAYFSSLYYLAVFFREFLVGADDVVEVRVHELSGDVDVVEGLRDRRRDHISEAYYLHPCRVTGMQACELGRSSKGFKLCRLVILGSMALRCINGDHDVFSCLRAGRRCRWAPWWRRQ
uniref:Secreted protein n=1 Tax=Triticum urartu TaxID=4572 RepID=A0A8R7U8I8_TRIUA